MKIREIEISDFPKIYALWKEAGIAVASFEKENEEFLEIITFNPASCFVIQKNSQIIGSCLGTFNGRRGWIYHLAIQPEYQNYGYGEMIFKKTERALFKIGAPKILLGVALSNKKVISFYEKQGYKIMDDVLVMEKELSEVI